MNQHKSSGGIFTDVSRGIKLVFDRLMAAFLLLLFSPILIVVAIVLIIRMGSPIMFTQARPGKDAKIFNVYKW
jgi:lipopolysaccharide/colanic/teichoic acid biosynthesis glycosyltransferase